MDPLIRYKSTQPSLSKSVNAAPPVVDSIRNIFDGVPETSLDVSPALRATFSKEIPALCAAPIATPIATAPTTITVPVLPWGDIVSNDRKCLRRQIEADQSACRNPDIRRHVARGIDECHAPPLRADRPACR